MSAEAFKLQAQIRQNAGVTQDYLRDLGVWEKAVKKKDRELARGKNQYYSGSENGSTAADKSPAPRVPPPRTGGGTVAIQASSQASSSVPPASQQKAAAEKAHQKVAPAEGKQVSAAQHTYDLGYRKWDKLDVDAMLKDADEEDEINAEELPPPPSKSTMSTSISGGMPSGAVTLPGKGAKAVLSPATIVGVVPQPRNVTVPGAIPRKTDVDMEQREREAGNELFRKGDYQGAVKCYTRCLGINSRTVMAFSNRAMAYLKLLEYRNAERDCTLALQLDASHEKSLLRRATARNALGKHRAALMDLRTAASRESPSPEVLAALKNCRAQLQSAVRKCPRKRIPVTLQVLPSLSRPLPVIENSIEAHTPEPTSTVDVPVKEEIENSAPPGMDEITKTILEREKELASEMDSGVTDNGVGDAMEVDTPSATLQEQEIEVNSSVPKTVPPVVPVIPKVPTAPPRTSYELEREWRNLRNHPLLLVAYVGSFTPKTYSKVLSDATDPSIVCDILVLMRDRVAPSDPKEAAKVLLSLPKMKGFDMSLLMLGGGGGVALRATVKLLEEASVPGVEDIRAIWRISGAGDATRV